MYLRALFVAATAAVCLPLAAAPAQASCRTDYQRDLGAGYADSPKSPYWNLGYVQVTGTATVHVYGDAAVSDYTAWADDVVRLTDTVVTNAPEATTEFADCVAG